jgi:hypothetical protein
MQHSLCQHDKNEYYVAINTFHHLIIPLSDIYLIIHSKFYRVCLCFLV